MIDKFDECLLIPCEGMTLKGSTLEGTKPFVFRIRKKAAINPRPYINIGRDLE